MVEKSELVIEEVYTDPLKTEAQIEADKVNDMYTEKGI